MTIDADMIHQLINRPTAQEYLAAPEQEWVADRSLVAAPIITEYQPDYLTPALEHDRRLFFDAWVSDWLADTQWQSSMRLLTRHSSFHDIKSLGPSAMRFVLDRMVQGDVQLHWFPLLHDLSGGADPVPAADRGIVPKMTAAWISWGRRAGLIDAA